MNASLELVAQIEELLSKLKNSLGAPEVDKGKNSPASPAKESFSGLSKIIFDLIQEGFFDEPKNLAEIQRKLRLEGINKPTTTLMSPLLHLLKKKKLSRIQDPGNKGPFKYQKR